VIVAGCGKIGQNLIENLVKEGHNIVAVDRSGEVLSEVTDLYDITSVIGNAVDCDILSEAGIENCDIFIAMTGSDEFNMLSCYLAKKMGAKETIARIRNPEFNDKSLSFLRQHLFLSMSINPEALTAKDLYNTLKFPGAVKIENFSRSNLEMIEVLVKENSAINGLSITKMREQSSAKCLVCAVQRGDNVIIPDGNFVFMPGDKVGITASPSEIVKFFKGLKRSTKQSKNVMILGGSKTAFYLSKMLTEDGSSVKIIDLDEKRCKELCDLLPDASIVCGDGARQEVLVEEGLLQVDGFVSLTGFDEQNVLIALYAAERNVPKVAAKINHKALIPMANKLGLDLTVSQAEITSNVIIGFARALENSMGSKVETLYKVMDGKVEALEFSVKSDSALVGKPLKELSLIENTLIAGIMRGRRTIIPSGDDVILNGDNVIVITTRAHLQDLSDIIKK
ncbi:MAG: Trk system potassium transporter TrkA, partial [Oscillospiraceae bacterium]|nr:Trk system potassium transporter TrkA [Candidatus Equicaccousia limihippi]